MAGLRILPLFQEAGADALFQRLAYKLASLQLSPPLGFPQRADGRRVDAMGKGMQVMQTDVVHNGYVSDTPVREVKAASVPEEGNTPK